MDVTTRSRAAGRVALAVVFLAFVDVFALLPTVAPYATSLGAGPTMLGIIIGAYSLANLPANLVGGLLIDRWGRRPVLLLGLALAAATVAAYPLAGTPGALLMARLAHGVAGGVLVPAVFTVAGDRARSGATGRVMGRLGAAIGLAAVIAPASAGVLRQAAGTTAVFVTVAGLLALGFVIAAIGLPGSPTPATADEPAPGAAGPAEPGMRKLLATPEVRRVLVAVATLTAAVGVLAAFLPGSVEDLGATPTATGGLFTIYAVVAAALMLSRAAGWVDRAGPLAPATAGLVALTLALGLFALPVLWLAVVASAVFGLGYGLVFPAVSTALSTATTAAARGRAFGLFNAAFSVGLATGPVIAGALTERLSALSPFLVPAALCLATAAWLSLAVRQAGAP